MNVQRQHFTTVKSEQNKAVEIATQFIGNGLLEKWKVKLKIYFLEKKQSGDTEISV